VAKKIGIWLSGFLVGLGLCLCLMNLPAKNQLWINPDTGFCVWTSKAPSGEYIAIEYGQVFLLRNKE
jgi:hypothetical protein